MNDSLDMKPEIVSEAPEGDGWFVKIKMSDPSQLASLMDEAGYKEFVKGQE
jgi:glycine cleavage system H protein